MADSYEARILSISLPGEGGSVSFKWLRGIPDSQEDIPPETHLQWGWGLCSRLHIQKVIAMTMCMWC